MGRNKKNQDKEEKDFKINTPKLDLAAETKRGIVVIVFIVLALVFLLSLIGIAGS